jgi:hypothetical protein
MSAHLPPDHPLHATSPLFLIYADLYMKYRGVLAMVARTMEQPAQHVETEIAAWVATNRARLLDEAWTDFQRFLRISVEPRDRASRADLPPAEEPPPC